MVAGQFNMFTYDRILPAEHENIKIHVTGKDIFHPVPCHLEGKTNVPDLVFIRGKGNLVCQPVLYGIFQHGSIAAAGIQGIQVFAEIGFPLGTVGIGIDAGT